MLARKDRIYKALKMFEHKGIVVDYQVQGDMPGLRWHVIACGYSERAMTTNEVEWFIMGVNAALNSK